MSADEISLNRDTSLVEVLDRVIHKGVVLQGDATLSVADVDLIYLGLKLVLVSADRLKPGHVAPPMEQAPTPGVSLTPSVGAAAKTAAGSAAKPPMQPVRVKTRSDDAPPPPASPLKLAAVETFDEDDELAPCLDEMKAAPRTNTEKGLAQLVLTLVELLRELMERQAVRRLDGGALTEEEIARMSEHFAQIAERMDELCEIFGLERDDLNLDLGPLGNLLD